MSAIQAQGERVYTVLIEPHITEKATNLGEAGNRYAFKVARDATKRDVKAAVEKLFGVTVESVATMRVKGKAKRVFGARGAHGRGARTKGWKKAYVRLAEGDALDYTEAVG